MTSRSLSRCEDYVLFSYITIAITVSVPISIAIAIPMTIAEVLLVLPLFLFLFLFTRSLLWVTAISYLPAAFMLIMPCWWRAVPAAGPGHRSAIPGHLC